MPSASSKVEIEISGRIEKLDRALARADQRVRSFAARQKAMSFDKAGSSLTGDLGINVRKSPQFDNTALERSMQRESQLLHRQGAEWRMYQRDVSAIQQKLGDRSQRESQRGGGGGDGMSQSAMKSLNQFRQVFKVIGMIEGAAGAVNIAIQAWKGNVEGTRAAFAALPVVGTASSMAFDAGLALKNYASLADDRLKEDAKREMRTAATSKTQLDFTKGTTERLKGMAEETADIRAGDDPMKQAALTQQRTNTRIAEINKEEKRVLAALKGNMPAQKSVRELAERERTHVTEQSSLKVEKLEIEAIDKRREKEKESAEQSASATAKAKISALEAAGKKLEAKEAEIMERRRVASEDAKSPEERQAIEKEAAAEINTARREDRHKRREDEFELRAKAKKQAEDRADKAADIIEHRELKFDDIGSLSRPTGGDKKDEIAQENNKLTEETNKQLEKLRQEIKTKQAFIEAEE